MSDAPAPALVRSLRRHRCAVDRRIVGAGTRPKTALTVCNVDRLTMRISSWGGMSADVRAFETPGFHSDLRQAARSRAPSPHVSRLVIGNLRSYGDEVLAVDGHYLQTLRCDRILNIDLPNHQVTAESGIRLLDLQDRLMSLGYVLPVTPGTALVTLGGAIANDVHGKNHHIAGTFGCHVREFELIRTTGESLVCSATRNTDVFLATLGGLGLTGVITWATVALRQASPMLAVNSSRFGNLDEFFSMDAESQDAHEYSVAWIDCLAGPRSLGRGIYSVADHVAGDGGTAPNGGRKPQRQLAVPFTLPVSPVNQATILALNTLYYRCHRTGDRYVHLNDWLYPLDSVQRWNRLYGRRGFYQFQCAVPADESRSAILDMLRIIARRGQGSFLAVLKTFGTRHSLGLMSFPIPGATLALDFPNRGRVTQRLLLDLHAITASAGGRLYPAKDGCSPPDSLSRGYANFEKFQGFLDPGLNSVMARRLRLTG